MFDAFLFVDWSGTSGRGPARPRRDALWTGEGWDCAGGVPRAVREQYHRTRAECAAYVRERLRAGVRAGLRILVGFDFPYGYPRGFSQALGLEGSTPWRGVWEAVSALVTDDAANLNNRFAAGAALNARCGPGPGPFWGCPAGTAVPGLLPTSPGFPCRAGSASLARLRRTDASAGGTIQEVWKLCYPGSVGGQALTGIPYLRALRDDPDLAPYSRVWPFETGLTPNPLPGRGPGVLHAEIWPVLVEAGLEGDLIRDQAQVRALVRWSAAASASGELAACFAAEGLEPDEASACEKEEGWILGVLPRRRGPAAAGPPRG